VPKSVEVIKELLAADEVWWLYDVDAYRQCVHAAKAKSTKRLLKILFNSMWRKLIFLECEVLYRGSNDVVKSFAFISF